MTYRHDCRATQGGSDEQAAARAGVRFGRFHHAQVVAFCGGVHRPGRGVGRFSRGGGGAVRRAVDGPDPAEDGAAGVKAGSVAVEARPESGTVTWIDPPVMLFWWLDSLMKE